MIRNLASILLLLCFVISPTEVHSQKGERDSNAMDNPPKLIVGIVVDQMRYDYLTRFWGHYGEGGFKRLVTQGFNCRNNHYNYAPTSTGPGHASIYTGTTPAVHGIIGNEWYDKSSGENVYCASDTTQITLGSTSDAGAMSPHRMGVTTITDQLKLHYQGRSKVIAVAIKDRGAVLPAGHTADAAYWFEGESQGNWVSSSFYGESLPVWVDAFNASNAAESYKKTWTTLKDISTYVESNPDNNDFESPFEGASTPTFPHFLPGLWDQNGGFEILRRTPYGNSLTTDFALEAMEKEEMGQDGIPDFLAISYSSTDYVGHKFGVDSKEVQDTYLRLDKDLERLLNRLDKKIGKGEYLVFLTADHGAVPVPSYLKSLKIPAGYLDDGSFWPDMREYLKFKYGTTELVSYISNYQVFLNKEIIDNLGIPLVDVERDLASKFMEYPEFQWAYSATDIQRNAYNSGIPRILQNGFHSKRSGNVLLVPAPAVVDYSLTGSTHGSPFIYDTHVPLLFYGKGIKPGQTARKTEIPDIAPTLSVLLGIAFPNGTTGQPIEAVLE